MRIPIVPIVNPRNSWEKAFKEMHDNGDDKLIIQDVIEDESLLSNMLSRKHLWID